MRNLVLSAALILFSLAILEPAAAGSRPVISGDPVIDAQWAAQLRGAPPVYGAQTPISLYNRQRLYSAPRPQAPATRIAPVQPRAIDPAYLPAVVDYATDQKPGTIVIDTRSRYLYLVQAGGKAQRYGVGVGRDGFGWSGTVTVGRKAEWPTWTPPAAMRQRQPYLPVSMPGGPDNPLGARALYLHRNGRDTLFRIHGSNEPWTIGQAVSSGCFRMRNEDVIALYNQVGIGTKVVVL